MGGIDMRQEDKELILKDLCARLPYGVRYRHLAWDDEHGEDYIAAKIYSINSDGYVKNSYDDETVYIDDVRPYLFPLSSMTEEQYDQLYIKKHIKNDSIDILDALVNDMDAIDYCNKNHLDWRGLIPKGLAIDATGLDIYK